VNAGTKMAEYLKTQVTEVKLKPGRLCVELLFNIRINCALFYMNKDVIYCSEDLTYWSPSDLEFEFIVL
jgi:hypothetical protein